MMSVIISIYQFRKYFCCWRNVPFAESEQPCPDLVPVCPQCWSIWPRFECVGEQSAICESVCALDIWRRTGGGKGAALAFNAAPQLNQQHCIKLLTYCFAFNRKQYDWNQKKYKHHNFDSMFISI